MSPTEVSSLWSLVCFLSATAIAYFLFVCLRLWRGRRKKKKEMS